MQDNDRDRFETEWKSNSEIANFFFLHQKAIRKPIIASDLVPPDSNVIELRYQTVNRGYFHCQNKQRNISS